jgi:short-subunit dehydrogenase
MVSLIDKLVAHFPPSWGFYVQIEILVLAILGLLSISTLVFPWLITFLTHRPQDLKKKYNAEWALVTGGSSGIGLSLCNKLAAQGLNIVMVAYPDDLLTKSAKELQQKYPKQEIRSVGVNLGKKGYMEELKDATKDITIQLLFNNAGYIVTGFFADTDWEKLEANYECNSTASVTITHYFLKKLRESGKKGLIAFTSSPANIIPSPFSCFYGATKSLLTHFATSLACEVAPEGIDVSVLHPSPVATNFYTGAHNLPTLLLFKSTATGADVVAQSLLNGIGRSVVIDQGYYPFLFRFLLRIIEPTFLAEILAVFAPYVNDYKYMKSQTKAVVVTKATSNSASGPSSSKKRAVSKSPSSKRK